MGASADGDVIAEAPVVQVVLAAPPRSGVADVSCARTRCTEQLLDATVRQPPDRGPAAAAVSSRTPAMFGSSVSW